MVRVQRRRSAGRWWEVVDRIVELGRPLGHNALCVRDGDVELTREAMRPSDIDAGNRSVDLGSDVNAKKSANILQLLFALELDKDRFRTIALLKQGGLLSCSCDGHLGLGAGSSRIDGEHVRSAKQRVVYASHIRCKERSAIERMRQHLAFTKDGENAGLTEEDVASLPLTQWANEDEGELRRALLGFSRNQAGPL